MSKILYLFITHQKNFEKTSTRVYEMMNKLNCNDFLIICGSNQTELLSEKKTLFVKCNDKYEGLPEKIIKTFSFVTKNHYLNNYTHFCKLDEDMIVNKLFGSDELINYDYCGRVNKNKTGNRKWHIGRCSLNSKFNNMPYNGIYVDWCMGGYGYIISRNAINNICEDNTYEDNIYEDLYVAILLKDKNIFPKDLNVTNYFISPNHK